MWKPYRKRFPILNWNLFQIHSTDCGWDYLEDDSPWFPISIRPRWLKQDNAFKSTNSPIHSQLISSLQVSWVRRKGQEQLHLITFGSSTYISDSRYSLEFKEPNDWQLHIQYPNERDAGQFECQINTSPPLVLVINLEVIGEFAGLYAISRLSLNPFPRKWILCKEFRSTSLQCREFTCNPQQPPE